MKEIIGNFWDVHTTYDAICVTTNGVIKNNGQLVMGAGMAKQFANRWPKLPEFLGSYVSERGNYPYYLCPKDGPAIVSFPTKHDWRDNSDLVLIRDSAECIVKIANEEQWETILSTRPGCGLGGLNWKKQVKPMLQEIWNDNRFTIISLR